MSFDPNDMGLGQAALSLSFHIPYAIRMDQSFPCRDVNLLDLKADYCHTHPQTGHHVQFIFYFHLLKTGSSDTTCFTISVATLDAFNYGSS